MRALATINILHEMGREPTVRICLRQARQANRIATKRLAYRSYRARAVPVFRLAPDALEEYVAGKVVEPSLVSPSEALEETFFLGLRLNSGVDLREVSAKFGENAIENDSEVISDCMQSGLMERLADSIRLTPRGRLLSNEVFERFISVPERAI